MEEIITPWTLVTIYITRILRLEVPGTILLQEISYANTDINIELTMAKRKQGNASAENVTSKGGSEGHNSSEEQPWSKSKKKYMRKLLKANNTKDPSMLPPKPEPVQRKSKKAKITNTKKQETPSPATNNASSDGEEKQEAPNASSDGLDLGDSSSSSRSKSVLQQSFLSRLSGSRFRELNEDLYTSHSSSAVERFQNNPELFDQYHEGFRTQVKSWPVNPLDKVYRWILSVHRDRKKEEAGSKLAVADFGCGDAKLAEKLLMIKEEGSGKSKKKKGETSSRPCPFNVHSFDMVANGNPHITPCDMANVPLKNGTVDVAVFVLALMGTNIADFIREAHRVLTPDGLLKIAEVRSRFESSSDEEESSNAGGKRGGGRGKKKGSNDSLFNEFIDVMQELGFTCTQKDRSSKMFILLEFEKTGKSPSKDATFTAKPCIYKRR